MKGMFSTINLKGTDILCQLPFFFSFFNVFYQNSSSAKLFWYFDAQVLTILLYRAPQDQHPVSLGKKHMHNFWFFCSLLQTLTIPFKVIKTLESQRIRLTIDAEQKYNQYIRMMINISSKIVRLIDQFFNNKDE